MALTLRGKPVKLSLAWLKPPAMPEDGNMTLFEHLRELRYRLVIAALTIIVGMIVCALFYGQLYAVLLHPYEVAKASLAVTRPGLETSVINQGVSAPLSLAVKIVGAAAILLTSPVWLYQLWAFIVPGLLAKEKKWAYIFVGTAVPLFLAGVALGYFIMPKGISVLLSFTPQNSDVQNLIELNTFLEFLIKIMLVFGVAFLIPVVVLLLNFLGVVKAKWLAKFRVYIIFGTCVFGAVATPSTDPFSMLALAIPMTALFMAAEIIAHINDRRRAARAGGDIDEYDTVLAQLQAEDKVEREARAAERQAATVVVARRPPSDPSGGGSATVTADPTPGPTGPTLAPAAAAAAVPEPTTPDSTADFAALIQDVPAYAPEQSSGVADTSPAPDSEPEPATNGGSDGFDIDAFKSAISSAGSDSEPARR